MATLIQSKQIQGIVTASVVEGDFAISGSLNVSGSGIFTNDITASGVISASQILGVKYEDIEGTPNFNAGTGISITQVADTITITNTGGGGGVSGSAELISSVALLNAYTASTDIRLDGLSSQTGSYLTSLPTGLVSGSDQLTSSYDQRYALSGSIDGGSTDISSLNDYTSSTDGRLTNIETFSSSIESRVSTLEGQTDNTGSDTQSLSIVGDQLTISDGNTVTIPTGSGVSTDITHLNEYTQSSDQRLTSLENQTSSYADTTTSNTFSGNQFFSGSLIPESSDSDDGIHSLGSATNPWKEIYISTSSLKFVNDEGVVDELSLSDLVTVESHERLYDNLISSSQQIQDLGFVTSSDVVDLSSLNTFTQSIESRVSTLESQTDNTGSDNQTLSIVGNQLTIDGGNTVTIPTGSELPSGVISGSSQITELGFTSESTDISSLNNFTSSYFTDSQSFDTRITTEKDRVDTILSGASADYDTFKEIVDLINSVDTTNDQAFATFYTASNDKFDSIHSFTQSIESRVTTLESQTDNTGSDSQTLSIIGDQLTIDGGNTVTIPTGSELPSGLFSGSILPGSNVTIDSSSGDYIISASIPGGGDTSYDGDRIVSNTLFGDLYSQSFNPGTSGSIQDFLDAVFFPQTAPTAEFTDQTGVFNTNLATNNTNLVSVALTDTVDNSPYTLTISGTNGSSLTPVPTNSDSSSWELRANGNLSAGTYSYDVTVGDSTNATRVYSGRSITIVQSDTGTLTPNGTFYIIESATNGDFIRTNSNGFSGGQGQVSVSYSPNYGSQTATNFQSSNPLISINSSTRVLTVGTDISGSGNTNGDTVTSTISWEDQYGNNGSDTITVNVTENTSPDIVFTNSSLLNTNQATGSSGTLVTISFTDTESDSINHDTFQFIDPSGQLQSTKSGEAYLVTATSDLSASNYTITCSVEDIHGFSTSTETHTFSISQADNGTLGGDTSIYIIESAESGDSFRDATGFGNGNLANISVSYSPNYGSQTATLSSSNPAISVDGSGNLTLGVDLSGSVTQSGDTFTSTISWEDQYGNTDSGTVTATVFGNQSPSATFIDNGLTDVTGVSGSNAATITITDTESNTPFSASIGGTDGGKFNLVPQNSNSSSYQVQPTGSLSIGDYSVQVVITDSYSETATLNETISVTSDSDFGKVYIYTSTRVGGGTLSPANYLAIMGGSGVNGETPPQVTSFTADTNSPFIKLVSGSLGDSTISVTGGTMTLRATVSGSDLTDIITGSFSGDGAAQEMFFIAFPSGSDMVGTPTSMTDSLGGSTSGEYVVYGKAAGESSFTVIGTTIHSLQFNSEKEGYSKWNIIGRTGPSTATSYELKLVPSSGSAPS